MWSTKGKGTRKGGDEGTRTILWCSASSSSSSFFLHAKVATQFSFVVVIVFSSSSFCRDFRVGVYFMSHFLKLLSQPFLLVFFFLLFDLAVLLIFQLKSAN